VAFTQDLFTSRRNYPDGNTRIGEIDRICYDSNTNTLRIGDGSTPGGIIISGGGSGDYTLPIATANSLGGVEIGTNISIDGNGKISVDLSSYATTTYVTNAITNKAYNLVEEHFSNDYIAQQFEKTYLKISNGKN
jgi:hypothetical protein